MKYLLVVLCLLIPVRFGIAQVIDDEDPVFTRIKNILVAAQHGEEIKPMTGLEAYQCFTDDDKKRFDANGDAKRIAALVTGSSEFQSALKELGQKKKDYQRHVLEKLQTVHDRLYHDGDHFGPGIRSE